MEHYPYSAALPATTPQLRKRHPLQKKALPHATATPPAMPVPIAANANIAKQGVLVVCADPPKKRKLNLTKLLHHLHPAVARLQQKKERNAPVNPAQAVIAGSTKDKL